MSIISLIVFMRSYFAIIAVIASPGISGSGPGGTANTLLIVLIILLAVILGAVYFVFSINKRYFDTKRIEIQKLFDSHKNQNEIWEKEFAKMKEKMDKVEEERKEWKTDREELDKKIKELGTQIELLERNDNDEEKDIVVEYFVDKEIPWYNRPARYPQNKRTKEKRSWVERRNMNPR